MNVLVDTSVWSLALRRKAAHAGTKVQALTELIREGRVLMVGPVRQELLSGIRDKALLDALREHLRAFLDEPLHEADFEQAAVCYNRCRERGVQGSNTDFLLCAVALRRKIPVFTTDKDFERYAAVLGVGLFAHAG
ncbi:MAG: type II toxin-antitoxin system VapC family toxin [Rudaea sp.]